MADIKFSALTATTTVDDADVYAVASGGDSKKITGANLKAGVAGDYKPGGTDVAVADGGTGASSASVARTNLGLVIDTDVTAKATFDAHLADTSDAHDASAISFTPVGTIAATDVQAAIAEVASEAAGGGSVATDTIWDTKGDLAVATAADTAAKLAAGANGKVLTADSAQTTGLKWQLTKDIELKVMDDATVVTTGDGKVIFCIPASLGGCDLTAAHAFVTTVSSSGLPTVQIRNVTQTADMLTTKITIDASEFTSYSAATAPVIDTGNDDVATGDLIAIDVDVAGTGAKGLGVILTFTLP